MRRREFITLLGGASVWPGTIYAQQSMAVVGFLSGGQPESFMPSAPVGAALREGLTEAGFVEGRNSRLNTAGLTVNPIACRAWLPISSAAVRG